MSIPKEKNAFVILQKEDRSLEPTPAVETIYKTSRLRLKRLKSEPKKINCPSRLFSVQLNSGLHCDEIEVIAIRPQNK